jgi:Tol biopolymer transport system component
MISIRKVAARLFVAKRDAVPADGGVDNRLLALLVVALTLPGLVVAATGSAHATSSHKHQLAAPGTASGRIVATASSAHTRLVSMLPDGSDRQRIVKYPRGAAFGGIDVTQDGAMIAVTVVPKNRGHIYTVNSDGSGFRQVSRGGDDSDPTFDPTGERIAFSRYLAGPSALMRMNTDRTGLRRLTSGMEPDVSFPSWSPDGKRIAFMDIGRKQQSIVLTDPHGTSFQFLRTFRRHRGQLFTMSWSPDSSKILFARFNKDYSNADLWTINSDGSNLTRITDTPNRIETSPVYSPEGSAIACSVSPKSEEWADVLVMDADGGNRHRIDTPNPDEIHVAWGD